MVANQKRQGPAGTGPESQNVNHCKADHSARRPIDRLLPLLRDVRSTGRDSWAATCPNGHAHKGGLSIREEADGRILLHCFKGCAPLAVLASVGLELADLFPERIRDATPEARRASREAFQRNAWQAALGVLGREANVCLIACGMARRGEVLAAEDFERLQEAEARIQSAREVLCGR